MIFHLLSSWHSCPCWRGEPVTMNQQQATLPCHNDASCWRVVPTMTIQQSCCRGLSGRGEIMPRYYWCWSTLCTVWQTIRTKRQLQQCKSQQRRNLIRLQKVIAQGICRAAGTISGFAKRCQGRKEHYISLILMCSIMCFFEKDSSMINFWAPCDHCVLHFGRFWVDTFNESTKLNQSQCGDSRATGK